MAAGESAQVRVRPLVRTAGVFVLVSLALFLTGAYMEDWMQSIVSLDDVPASDVEDNLSTILSEARAILEEDERQEAAQSGGLYVPGKPVLTYVSPTGQLPRPTATPPPDRVLSDEDWFSPVIPLANMLRLGNLGSCALVGSHAALKGRKLGKEIEDHDVVIRINNVYNFDDDVGYRTDIYWATMCKLRFAKLGLAGTKTGPSCNYFCREGWPDTNYFQAKCPFRMVLMAGLNASSCHSALITLGYESVREISENACYPTGMVNDAWSAEIQDIRRFPDRKRNKYWGRPTTGFHAVVVMGYLCKNLTLYGMGVDVAEHTIDKRHAPEKERELLHNLVDGILEPEYWRLAPIMNATLRRKTEEGALRFAF